jgi:hypothetical protein
MNKYTVNVRKRIPSTVSCCIASTGGALTRWGYRRPVRVTPGRRDVGPARLSLQAGRIQAARGGFAAWRGRVKRIANRCRRGYAQHHNLAVRQQPQ